jgi:UDP-N-acetylmuramoylalanine--D-glutamate ligase
VGGNIGVSLLESLPEIEPEHLVLLELSSFQLENLGTIGRGPHVGVVLNLSPNHLDRHGTMENYVAAKRQIVAHVGCDTKVLNWDDPAVTAFAAASQAEDYYFSLKEPPPAGAWAHDDRIELAVPDGETVLDVSRRRIPGWFNLANMAAAATSTSSAAIPAWNGWKSACEEVFSTFPGVEHRLEFVTEKNGVKYYNDSKATDAEATLAALDTLPGPFVLILGGFDKKTPWEAFARAIAQKPVRAAVLMGQTAPAIEAALRASSRPPDILRVANLEEAVRVPAKPGETVLLSPACASWDMFRNFTERGLFFKALVAALPSG